MLIIIFDGKILFKNILSGDKEGTICLNVLSYLFGTLYTVVDH